MTNSNNILTLYSRMSLTGNTKVKADYRNNTGCSNSVLVVLHDERLLVVIQKPRCRQAKIGASFVRVLEVCWCQWLLGPMCQLFGVMEEIRGEFQRCEFFM